MENAECPDFNILYLQSLYLSDLIEIARILYFLLNGELPNSDSFFDTYELNYDS